jgi:hypothetical protein
MARMSVPRWSVYVVAAALIASLSFSFGSIYSAFGTSHGTTYYACLYAGSLSQVGETQPANCGRGSVISWNSDGPQGLPGATNVVMRSTAVVLGQESGASAEVDCEPGEVATGGGYFGGLTTSNVWRSAPFVEFQSDIPVGWRVSATNPTMDTGILTAYVICASP